MKKVFAIILIVILMATAIFCIYSNEGNFSVVFMATALIAFLSTYDVDK